MTDQKSSKSSFQPELFFDHIEDIKRRIDGRILFLVLDYDGTLAPMADTPQEGGISESMRQTVRRAAEKMTAVVISGHPVEDVRQRMRLPGIFYAGSHGFEIIDPLEQATVHEKAKKLRKPIDQVHAKISQRLKGVKGVFVEHAKYTISVHYRLAAEQGASEIRAAVEEVLKEYPQLEMLDGNKALEIRPKVEWGKGWAVSWILDYLDFDPSTNFLVTIGNDTTDEDMLGIPEGAGFGVLVSDHPRSSQAAYVLRNTEDVQKALEFFLTMNP